MDDEGRTERDVGIDDHYGVGIVSSCAEEPGEREPLSDDDLELLAAQVREVQPADSQGTLAGAGRRDRVVSRAEIYRLSLCRRFDHRQDQHREVNAR